MIQHNATEQSSFLRKRAFLRKFAGSFSAFRRFWGRLSFLVFCSTAQHCGDALWNAALGLRRCDGCLAYRRVKRTPPQPALPAGAILSPFGLRPVRDLPAGILRKERQIQRRTSCVNDVLASIDGIACLTQLLRARMTDACA